MEETDSSINNMYPRELPNASERREAVAALSNRTQGRFGVSRSLIGWVLIISIGLLVFFINHNFQVNQKNNRQDASAGKIIEKESSRSLWIGMSGAAVGLLMVVGASLGMKTWRRRLDAKAVGLWPVTTGHFWCNIGIFEECDGTRSGTKWCRFIGYMETPQTFLLLTDNTHGIIIPKRGLGVEAEIATFRTVLNGCLSRREVGDAI